MESDSPPSVSDMNTKKKYVPELSREGNHDEYHVPRGPLGDAVCALYLTWALVDGHVQCCIVSDLITYPGYKRLTRDEAFALSATYNGEEEA